eukprot:1640943-Amphidinium_carterae.2
MSSAVQSTQVHNKYLIFKAAHGQMQKSILPLNSTADKDPRGPAITLHSLDAATAKTVNDASPQSLVDDLMVAKTSAAC